MGRDTDIEIFELVKAAMHLASTRIQRSLNTEGVFIAPMEARCLRYVVRNPGCTQKDIVMASGRDKAQIARVIKLLIERGLLTRLADEAGERRHRLLATSEGHGIHEQAERHRTRVAKTMVEALDGAERQQLHRFLQQVTDQLKNG